MTAQQRCLIHRPGGGSSAQAPRPWAPSAPRDRTSGTCLCRSICPVSPELCLWAITSRSMTPPGPPRLAPTQRPFLHRVSLLCYHLQHRNAHPQNDLDYLRKGRHRRSSETLEALRKDAHIYEGSLCLSCTPLHWAVKGDSQSQETLIA